MEPKIVLYALIQIWDELPTLFGPQWVEIFPRLEALLDQLTKAQSHPEQASLVADLVLLFRNYPDVRKRMLTVVEELRQEAGAASQREEVRGSTTRESEPAPANGNLTDTIRELQELVDAPIVTRYTDITAPRHLALGQRGVITVRVMMAPSADSVAVQALEVHLKQTLEVCLQFNPQDFEGFDEPLRRLDIDVQATTQPAVFYIRAMSQGTKHLTLDFRQTGITIGKANLVIEVVPAALPEEQLHALIETVQLGGHYAPPPDLEIRVVVEDLGATTRLKYTVHSPNGVAGFHYQPVGESILRGGPAAYQQGIMQKMEALAAGKDVDGYLLTPQQVENKLAAVGHELYEQLFSPEMRSAYRRFHNTVHTILITSDEPWIPWELVKPYDDSDPGDVIDHDFLCVQFQVTRWLAGRSGAAGKIVVSRLACVEAGDVSGYMQLTYAQSERQYFTQLATTCPALENASPSPATGEAVEALLDQGGIHLWHFAAHGNMDFSAPNESPVVLSDGRKLRPEDIHAQRQTHVAQDRPLVFLNACRVGQQNWSLTRLGGWASAWVDRCRCGAFIGPLWSVDDWLAYEFARGFYDTLREGCTIGQAMQSTRRTVRDLATGNPTWLAYSTYAHPNARVKFGE
jgi:CHAT domain